MPIANLSLRSKEIITILWWKLQQVVEDAGYGHPYEQWDILQRICFSWFMAIGPMAVGTQKLRIQPEAATKLHRLINALRSQPLFDMVSLLQHPAVRLFVRDVLQYFTPFNQTATIWSFYAQKLETLSNLGVPTTEYVCVRHDDEVHL